MSEPVIDSLVVVLPQCRAHARCGEMNQHVGPCRARWPRDLDELEAEYEAAGPWLRRKDASNKLVSPLLKLTDVFELFWRQRRAPNVDQRAAARRQVEDAISVLTRLRSEPMFGGQWACVDESLISLRCALADMQETPGP